MSGLDDVLQQQEDGEVEATPGTAETNDGKEEVKEVQGKEEEGSSSEGEKVKDGEQLQDQIPPEQEAPAVPPDNNELNELRQFIREQRKEIAAMKAKLSRVKDTGEVDDEGNQVVSYTPIEKMQIELHNIATTRAPMLEVLAEAMEANPKYADIYSVCTKSNFDDIFEMAAAEISKRERRDFNEVLVQLELEVWQKPNPYKYMYSIIKENHPKYKGKETTTTTKKSEIATEEVKPKTPETAKKVLEAKAAPGSVAAAGAGENLGSGWTAAKIDALSEMELHQVPKDIYDRYMKGQLK